MHPLALAAGSLLDADALTMVEAAAAAGFAAVGVRLPDQAAMDRRALTAVRSRADALGLRVHDVEVHRIGAGSDIGPLADAAAVLGAPSVLVVSDLPDRTATLEALGAVAERCRAAGVTAALETMAWTTPSSPLDAVAMADATGCVVLVDVLHHIRVGAGPEELRAVVRSGRLGWVQLCDAPAAAPADLLHEARHGRLPPGDGALPLADLLAAVPAATMLSVEVQSDALRRLPPGERAALLYRTAATVAVR